METTRQQKIDRLIQKELGEMFQRQTQAMRGVLVSVSNVRVSPDLSVCNVYVSVFPSEKADEIVKNLNDNVRSIRYDLGQRVRHQLRIIPELKFFKDDTLDYIEHIDELLSNK
jgi:ribosome-binding factor A